MKDNITIIHVPDEDITIEFNQYSNRIYVVQDGSEVIGFKLTSLPPLQMALEYANGYAMSKVGHQTETGEPL